MPVLLPLHIIICSLGYLLFGVTSLIAYVYLKRERAIKAKTWRLDKPFRFSLYELDRCLFASLTVGFVAMGLGLPMGIILQEAKYGFVDLTSPRILFPTVIWLFYLLILAFRLLTGLRGKIPSYMSVYGFHATVISFVLELYLAAV
ncbi:cytochrome c biogenesis protein CcsA [Desulfovibrio inopinatus]|uniref:cytochrome c biogenesis protein CcsA n=1 Tax=Desulfovibrio inopinatus TaxID=102109 RepID=UPI00048229BB|nr:cytochrome c biogenesis protein CcsA [Desulfovibrio inopinatus]